MLTYISNLILPTIVLLIIIYGIIKKTPIYDTFIEGAKESFEMILSMFPYLLGMILGINIFLKSDILNTMLQFIEPTLTYLKIPFEIVPLTIMRPISGSSALVLLNSLLMEHGPDSLIGRLGAIIQGSTETTLYVITLYFGSIGIKKIKYALWAGLIADIIGIIASIIVVNLMF